MYFSHWGAKLSITVMVMVMMEVKEWTILFASVSVHVLQVDVNALQGSTKKVTFVMK